PAQAEYARYLRRVDDSARSQNELQRRICERSRRAGLYSAAPPAPVRPVAPHRWITWPLGIALLIQAGLGIVVGQISHHALRRTGRYANLAGRALPLMFVIPSMVLLVGAVGYGIDAWRLFTVPMVGCG